MKTETPELDLVGEQYQHAWTQLREAVDHHNLDRLRHWTERAHGWQTIQQRLIEPVAPAALADDRPCYHLDTWFLQDLIRYLTPGPDEVATYLTGTRCSTRDRNVSRICSIRLAKQSAVRAIGDARSCSDVLIEIERRGLRVEAMAHSHPGSGPRATMPSSIDLNYLASMERAGAQILGIIVTRDGHVRFFTHNQPFHVEVQGNGVNHVDEMVCRIDLA